MPDEINVTLEDESPVIEVQIIGTGPVGPTGGPGPAGPEGPAGVGVPSGGTTGQVLKKRSGTDYDTEWADESGGGVTDYGELTGKPSIEGVTLSGNKTAAQLGLAKVTDIPAVPVQSVNGKTGPVVLGAEDVGALPDDTPIPAAVTEQTVAGWGFTKNTGTYSKPSGGIPKTDLASDVQTSLGKADTALQSVPSTYRTAAAQDVIDAGKITAPSSPATGAFLVWDGSAWTAQTLSAILLNPANGGIVPTNNMTLIVGNFFMNVKNGYVSLTMRIKVKGTWTANQPNVVATLPQSTIAVIGQTSVNTLCKIGDSQIGTVNINTWGGGNTISVTPPSVPAPETEIQAAFITFPVT
jgi:hypothetical protein